MRKSNLIVFRFYIIDIISLMFSYLLSFFIRFKTLIGINKEIYVVSLLVMIMVNITLYLFINPFGGVLSRNITEEIKHTLFMFLFSMLGTVTILYLLKKVIELSRILLVLTYLINLVVSFITRLLYKKQLKKKFINSLVNGNRSLLIISKKNNIENTINKIENNNYNLYRITGICIVDDIKTKKIAGYTNLVKKDSLLRYISTNWIDEILIDFDYYSLSSVYRNGIEETGIPIHIVVNYKFLNGRDFAFENISDLDVITMNVDKHSYFEYIVKRIIDIIGSIFGCILAFIIILVVAPFILVKSPGKIIYSSTRIGKNGKPFKFYKIRSMIDNADELKESLMDKNINKDSMMFKIKNDPRIIPGIGSFIRKTSLDEFPQFFNVLKGEMSIVGTRPPTLDEWNKYSPYYRSRLTIKPGITGLWQISGRSNIVDFNEVVKLDTKYINNWNIVLDIIIIIKTITNMFKKDKGAM